MRRTGKRSWMLAGMIFWVASAWAVPESDRSAEPTPPGKIEFVGKNLFATANGTFHDWRIVESRLDLERLSESFAVVEVDLASVDTGIERRDDHLRDPDFFEVERYPVATVRVHSFRADGRSEAGQPRYAARFDFDLHGVTKTLDGQVVLVSASPPRFEGSLVVDRTDFVIGSPPSRWNPMAVGAEIPVHFEVEVGDGSGVEGAADEEL